MSPLKVCCLWYCKSTIFQANHNSAWNTLKSRPVVCDTAKVRFFKQITTGLSAIVRNTMLFVILQKYDFSSKSQPIRVKILWLACCLWYCKSTIFQANHNYPWISELALKVVCDTAKVRFFKQITTDNWPSLYENSCLWYCKSTIFQANHNLGQQTLTEEQLFVILQKYDFSSKSQPDKRRGRVEKCCLWYCKSTIFQANHN